MEKLKQKHDILLQALSTLQEAVASMQKTNHDDPNYSAWRDSIIKRFEYCSDLFWKYLKLILEKKHGVMVASPRFTYREAATAQIITEQESSVLLRMLDDRNQTSHVYRAVFAEELAGIIPNYYDLMYLLAQRITP